MRRSFIMYLLLVEWICRSISEQAHIKRSVIIGLIIVVSLSPAGGDVTDDNQTLDGSHAITSSPLMIIESFLTALTNTDQDGRIVITKKKGGLYNYYVELS